MLSERDRSADERPRLGRQALAWGTLLWLAWLIYEITAYPFAGPVLAGAKVAFKDFRTAFWLRSADPNPHRGRIAFSIYASWGLTKLFVTAFAFCPLVELLRQLIGCWLPAQGPNLGWDMQLIVGAWLTMVTALVVLPLVAVPAFWSARRLGQKVWVNSKVSQSCRRGDWPPSGGDVNHFTFLEFIILLHSPSPRYRRSCFC